MRSSALVLSMPIRVFLTLVALVTVLIPMLAVAIVWGPDARIGSVSPSWFLLLVVLFGCICSFAAGATLVYLARAGKGIRLYCGIAIKQSKLNSGSRM